MKHETLLAALGKTGVGVAGAVTGFSAESIAEINGEIAYLYGIPLSIWAQYAAFGVSFLTGIFMALQIGFKLHRLWHCACRKRRVSNHRKRKDHATAHED